MNLANEGLEARKKDEEIAGRKRKAEEDKNWEGTSLSFDHLGAACVDRISLAYREQRPAGRQLAVIRNQLEEEEENQSNAPGMRSAFPLYCIRMQRWRSLPSILSSYCVYISSCCRSCIIHCHNMYLLLCPSFPLLIVIEFHL